MNGYWKKIVALLLVLFGGCEMTDADQEEIDVEMDQQAIVDVPHTPVERQSIGNCWIYAQATWAESLHKKATGEDFDISQSYWTYMHWFLRIYNKASFSGTELETGGGWSDAKDIVLKYGLVSEIDFIKDDSNQEQSYRQASALTAINRALFTENGALFTADARADRVKVRAELDKAWGLTPSVVNSLNTVFGQGLENTFADSTPNEIDPDGAIIQPDQFDVKYSYGPIFTGRPVVRQTLKTAFNEWNTAYGFSTNVLTSVKKALHAQEPALISWFVDFNALEYSRGPLYGSFNLQTLTNAGVPGNQGGHMTVLEDYEVTIPVREQSEETIDSFDVGQGTWYHYGPFAVNGKFSVNMSGQGDADLYVRFDQKPTSKEYNCRPYKSNSNESCEFDRQGSVYVSVHGYKMSSGIQLVMNRVNDSGETLTLKAGVTLDPQNPEDAKNLAAALQADAKIVFLRVKNSWGGAGRIGLPYAPGPFAQNGQMEKGYHDLYMDYLTASIPTKENPEETKPALRSFILPPGYYSGYSY